MVVPRQPDVGTREDRLEALHRQLVDAVEELSTSEGWARMLQAAARFHDYSPSNVLLISAQRPDATRVAGIRTWNSLGRRVRRGEHGIAILAPCVYPAPPGESTEQRTLGAQAPGAAQPDGRSTSVEPERHLRGFRVVHVFDVTQTEGEPLPDASPSRSSAAGRRGSGSISPPSHRPMATGLSAPHAAMARWATPTSPQGSSACGTTSTALRQ